MGQSPALWLLFCLPLSLQRQDLAQGPNLLVAEDTADFTLTVAQEDSPYGQVRGVLKEAFNFSLAVSDWDGERLEVHWQSSGVYVVALDDLGPRLVFTRDGPSNQTVRMRADLIGIFTLRFYSLDSQGGRRWVEEGAELQIRRDNQDINKMITMLFTGFLGIALLFMGMEIDISVVVSTIKVILWT